MGAMARAYLPEQRRAARGHAAWTVPAIFWTALAAGVLLKGPVIPMIVVLTAVTLAIVDRSARWMLALRPLRRRRLVRCCWCCPGSSRSPCVPATASSPSRSGRTCFSKLFQGQESHGAPPGYYFLLFWVTFWPAATLAGLAAPAVFAARREPGAKFLLAWIVPSWIVFELVVTKLPHYVLPLYPAIAILIAGVIDARALSSKRWLERGTIWWFILPVLLGLAGIVRADRHRTAIRLPGLAVDRGVDGDGIPRLAALSQRRCRAFAAARARRRRC